MPSPSRPLEVPGEQIIIHNVASEPNEQTD